MAGFAADLDDQVVAAQGEVEELFHLKTLLPYSQRYVDTRDLWHQASSQLEDGLHQQNDDAKRVADALARANEAHAALTSAREQLGKMQNQKAVADHELTLTKQQIDRFEQVGSEATCLYCGQPLSAEHLATEWARLETTLAENDRKAATTASAEAAALKVLCEAEAHAKASDADHHAALKAQREIVACCDSLIKERSRLESEGWQALEKVRESNGELFPLPTSTAIELCFAEPEPTTDDLASSVSTNCQQRRAPPKNARAITKYW